MHDRHGGFWIWPGGRDDSFGRLASAGLGMLAGIAVMTAIFVEVNNRRGTVRPSPGPLTVGKLAAYCSGCSPDGPCEQDVNSRAFCLGVITGVLDSRPLIGRLCPPQGEDDRVAADSAFLAWSRTHPGSKDLPAALGIVRAYSSAYDCRKPGSGV